MANQTEKSAPPGPEKPKSILFLENDPDDAALCLRALKNGPLNLRVDVVTTLDDYARHLAAAHYDVVRALSRFANTMRLHSRATDTYTRIGEDEFVAILPETPAEGAAVLGAKIANRLAGDPESPALSCSFGATVYPRDGETLEDVLKVARNNLRQPKKVRREP